MSIGPVYRCLLDAARERGIDTTRILSDFGLTEHAVLSPEARLLPELGRALAVRLVQRIGDPELGLRGAERFRLADVDLLGYVAWHSTSLREMFEALSQYARLLGDTAECALEHGPGTLTVRLGRSGGRVLMPEASDFFAGMVARLVREWSHGAAELLSVQLPRSKPQRTASYERFFAAPVQFGAATTALTYREQTAESEVRPPDNDPALGSILRRHADRALMVLPHNRSVVERARAQLGKQLDAQVGQRCFDLGSIAAQLGTSERTLRRRLREAGTGYRELIDDVRRERAMMLVHEGAHNVTTMSMQVGFADVTTFTRAFRRWTGTLPSRYMMQARAQARAQKHVGAASSGGLSM
jgi:AraC-like DNA-binding protein